MAPYNASDMLRAMQSTYGLGQDEPPHLSLVARFGHVITTVLRRPNRTAPHATAALPSPSIMTSPVPQPCAIRTACFGMSCYNPILCT